MTQRTHDTKRDTAAQTALNSPLRSVRVLRVSPMNSAWRNESAKLFSSGIMLRKVSVSTFCFTK